MLFRLAFGTAAAVLAAFALSEPSVRWFHGLLASRSGQGRGARDTVGHGGAAIAAEAWPQGPAPTHAASATPTTILVSACSLPSRTSEPVLDFVATRLLPCPRPNPVLRSQEPGHSAARGPHCRCSHHPGVCPVQVRRQRVACQRLGGSLADTCTAHTRRVVPSSSLVVATGRSLTRPESQGGPSLAYFQACETRPPGEGKLLRVLKEPAAPACLHVVVRRGVVRSS